MKERIIKFLLLLFVMGIISLICYNTGKSTACGEDFEYFKKTEALLDSMAYWDPTFMDTVMETDAYCEYEEARKQML